MSAALATRMPRTSYVVIALVSAFAACAPASNPAHSVAIGGSCNYDVDCVIPTDAPNAIASCACGTCEEQYQLGVTCGDDGRVCNADETCAFSADGSGGCMPSAGEGASCEVVDCLPGLFCANAVCARAAAVGASCDPTNEDSCAAPAFCDGASATCVPLGATGAACDWTRYERAECVAGDGCSIVSSMCVEERDDGATCTDDAGCLSGFCAPGGECETRSCT